MKKIISILILLVFVAGISQAQDYRRIKVNMSNGLTIKGSNAVIKDDVLTYSSNGMVREIAMPEVNSILAKSGKAEKFALGCGAGCLVAGLLSVVSTGEAVMEEQGLTMGSYVAGVVIDAGIAAGLGYLIGSLFDPYEVVYIKQTSFLNKMHININTNSLSLQPIPGKSNSSLSLGTPMLSLSYQF
jgi:hypothetical protein